MPIFTSNRIKLPDGEDHDLIDIELDKDKMRMKHVQDVGGIIQQAELLRNYSDNGFTSDRNMRHIATIPAGEFVNHPEWAYDEKALIKWLKSEEGRPYRTVTKGI